MDSDASSDVEESFDETCPQGCDKAIYSAVLELREKRLDEEDKLSDIQKVIDVVLRKYIFKHFHYLQFFIVDFEKRI